MNEIKGFAGTHAPAKGTYPFLYDVQKDAFVETDSFYPVKDAKYSSYYRNRLALSTQLADARLRVLVNGRELPAGLENSTACYVVQGEGCVCTVNYHDGTLIRYRFNEEGLHEESVVHIQHGTGTYQAILTGAIILIPCRLLDHVYVYERTSMELIRVTSSPRGTGIRHGILDDHRRLLCMINKDNCEVLRMNMEQGGVITGKLSLLRGGEQGGGAAIRISSSGGALYVSVHGINQLYVIDITQWRILQRIPSGGDHPRDINSPPQGDYLFAADRNSDSLVVFKIDHISRILEEEAHTDTIPEDVSVVSYKQEGARTRVNNIGMVDLTVIGRSLASNIAGHGYKVGSYNRSYAMTEYILEAWPYENFTGYSTLEGLVVSLEKPCRVMLMVKAGKAVDATIEQSIPLLEQGDIIPGGGNSFLEDAIRREAYLKGKGLHYFGVGIPEGEDGTRFGPSIMSGGNRTAYGEIRPILGAVAARAEDGTPCCTYIGENGTGYYVKMVRNGVEYASMQLVAETYLLLKHAGHFDNAQLVEIFNKYQKGELNSLLIHIISDIFYEQDDKGGKELTDCIRDVTQQRSTGRWTSIEALRQGMDVSMIAVTGNIRAMSNNENRKTAKEQYPRVETAEISNSDAFKEEVRQGLCAVKVTAYTQGFDLLKQISVSYGWEFPLGKIASISRAGCIVRAKFLNNIARAYEQQTDLSYLLLDNFFQERAISYEKNLRQTGAQVILNGIPVPAMVNAISYLGLFCAARAGANLIQTRHNYFSARAFERVDGEGSFHYGWRWWA